MRPLIMSYDADTIFFEQLYTKIDAELGYFEHHIFPDGESYIRISSDCKQRDVIIVSNLHRPNAKILPLFFLCEALKEQGAQTIQLICPYLPYMRQDIQFREGEAVTSRTFAKLMSQYFDALVTIDPHLHRYKSLSEIYSLQSTVLHAHPAIAYWIKQNINAPLIIGPDSESEQWAASVAGLVGCPYIILEKTRKGDKDVSVSPPHAHKYTSLRPVLIDDIISTGRTMITTAQALKSEGFKAAVCIGVHGIFSETAYVDMKEAEIAEIITCNTIPHATNKIDITTLIAEHINSA